MTNVETRMTNQCPMPNAKCLVTMIRDELAAVVFRARDTPPQLALLAAVGLDCLSLVIGNWSLDIDSSFGFPHSSLVT